MYIELKNLRKESLNRAEILMANTKSLETVFIFISGNDLFPRRKRKKSNKDAWRFKDHYRKIFQIAKHKQANKIVIVPCFFRSVKKKKDKNVNL